MSHGLSDAAPFPPKRQITEEKIIMKAIVVTDHAAERSTSVMLTVWLTDRVRQQTAQVVG
jgi:hypothetical protein